MRFLLDEDVNPAVAEVGRGRGLEVISIHELDRRGFTDEEQLLFSIDQGRVFVTRNRNDFLRLTLTLFQKGELYPGLLIVARSLPNDRPEAIALAIERWAARAGDPGPYFVDFLSATT